MEPGDKYVVMIAMTITAYEGNADKRVRVPSELDMNIDAAFFVKAHVEHALANYAETGCHLHLYEAKVLMAQRQV